MKLKSLLVSTFVEATVLLACGAIKITTMLTKMNKYIVLGSSRVKFG